MPSDTLSTASAPSESMPAVALYDARPFFEKALQYGLQQGLISPEKLDAICADAPKGMVQIARYFGTEFLRPELEKAKDRMVNLVSLYLEHDSNGDLHLAAQSLGEHSFLSRSKGGSDLLKKLIAMPQNSHFGMNERSGFTDDHIPLLAKWSLRSLADYQLEWNQRSQVALVMDAAIWLAERLGLDADALDEAGKDAEAVIRTALLVGAAGRRKMPDWVGFEQMIQAFRQKHESGRPLAIALPKNLPAEFENVVAAARASVISDLDRLLDTSIGARKLFDQTPAFMGRYFWVEDALSEVDHLDRTASVAWDKATGGNSDDGSLLTLFVCLAAGAKPQTLLTEKSATSLVRKIQKAGASTSDVSFKPELADQYILDHAPFQYQDDYLALWADFVEEAQTTLLSDAVHAQKDALALLRRECHVKS